MANQNQLQGSLTKAQEQASWLQLKNGSFYATNGAVCQNAILRRALHLLCGRHLDEVQHAVVLELGRPVVRQEVLDATAPERQFLLTLATFTRYHRSRSARCERWYLVCRGYAGQWRFRFNYDVGGTKLKCVVACVWAGIP